MEDFLYWLVGGFGVPIINLLKGRFDLNGKAAMWLSASVAAVLACISLFFTQQVTFVDFLPTEIFSAFGQILSAATLAYKLLVKEQ